MMNDNPCGNLEKECQKAWEKWQAALKKAIDGVHSVTKPLGSETPPPSGTLGAEEIALRRQYDELAAKLRECYVKHDTPLKEQVWPRSKSS